jgi:hypothetical protein
MSRLPFANALRVKSRDPQGYRAARRTERGGSATFKPAPFAEKKNAKDAAPAKSIRGAMEVRCEAKVECLDHAAVRISLRENRHEQSRSLVRT